MKSVRNFLALTVLAMVASTSVFAYGGVAVILFNPQTGQWAASTGNSSRYNGEVAAMNLNANLSTDIAALESGNSVIKENFAINGWVALAKGNNGVNNVYGAAGSPNYNAHDSQYDAEQSALANCGGAANGCYIVRSLASYSWGPDLDGVRNSN